ncbi:MAG TPA: hypothetical protein PLQ97_11345 [Myxococcota bacterium]|nr:hypothetical protein [Myxococcota bacterium]HQK51725.1 hypothetical protein [Myxococcota bacterium]
MEPENREGPAGAPESCCGSNSVAPTCCCGTPPGKGASLRTILEVLIILGAIGVTIYAFLLRAPA